MGTGASSRTGTLNGVEQVDSMIADDFRNTLTTTLVRKLLKSWHASDEELKHEVGKLVHEYLIFIWLRKLYPLQTMPASKHVDIVWHQHILYTREYAQFCKRNLGSFLHHTPKMPSTGSTADKSNPNYTKLLIRYRYHTKSEPPEEFWPQSDTLRAQETALKRQMLDDGSHVRFWDDEISKPTQSTNARKKHKALTKKSSSAYSVGGADLTAAII